MSITYWLAYWDHHSVIEDYSRCKGRLVRYVRMQQFNIPGGRVEYLGVQNYPNIFYKKSDHFCFLVIACTKSVLINYIIDKCLPYWLLFHNYVQTKHSPFFQISFVSSKIWQNVPIFRKSLASPLNIKWLLEIYVRYYTASLGLSHLTQEAINCLGQHHAFEVMATWFLASWSFSEENTEGLGYQIKWPTTTNFEDNLNGSAKRLTFSILIGLIK